MTENFEETEAILLRYRPAGPSPELRRRVLGEARPVAQPSGATWTRWLARVGVAAGIVLAAALNHAADRMMDETAQLVGAGPVHWTAEAEETVEALGGDEASRQYVARCLAGSPRGFAPSATPPRERTSPWKNQSRRTPRAPSGRSDC